MLTGHREKFTSKKENDSDTTGNHLANSCSNVIGHRTEESLNPLSLSTIKPIVPDFHPKKIPISLSMVVACRRLIHIFMWLEQYILRLSHQLYMANYSEIKYSLYRYETFWLPLAAQNKLYTGAPMDIYFVWLVHMMDPVTYRRDCQSITGDLVEHRLVSAKKLKQMMDKAKLLWNTKYPGEKFDLDPVNDIQFPVHCGKISKNLIKSALSHYEFFYQVRLPHFSQSRFLEEASRRYEQFLYIRKIQYQIMQQTLMNQTILQTTDCFELLPFLSNTSCHTKTHLPYDIELCWRAHIFHPRSYAKDTSCLFGRILPYYDTLQCIHTRRSAKNSTLNCKNIVNPEENALSTLPVDALWKRLFSKDEFSRNGCLYRGSVSWCLLDTLESRDLDRIATKYTQIEIQSVSLKLNPDIEKFLLRIDQECKLPTPTGSSLIGNGNGNCVAKLNSPNRFWEAADSDHPIGKITMISGVCDTMTVSLVDKRGWWCPSNNLLSSAVISLTDVIEDFQGEEPLLQTIACHLDQHPSSDHCRNIRISNGTISSAVLTTSEPRETGKQQIQSLPRTLLKSYCPSTITMSLRINPPLRHAIRLRVKHGPQLVCRLPSPSEQLGSPGYKVWGPIAQCTSLSLSQNLFEHYQATISSESNEKGIPMPDEFNLRCEEKRSLVSIHRIMNHSNRHVLTVRILHNVKSGLSVVQVYSGHRLICLGHPLGKEQLPFLNTSRCKMAKATRRPLCERFRRFNVNNIGRTSSDDSFNEDWGTSNCMKDINGQNYTSEECKNSVTCENQNQSFSVHVKGSGLNLSPNERAMLVKDANGDWCIIIGYWSDFKRFPGPVYSTFASSCSSNDQSERFDSNGTYGRGGHLALRFRWFNTPEPKTSYAQVPDNTNSYYIILNDASVNMKTGELFISKSSSEVAQNVCLAFCCGILHVLCQPRVLTHEQMPIYHSIPSQSSTQTTQSSIYENPSPDRRQLDTYSALTRSTSFESNDSISEPNGTVIPNLNATNLSSLTTNDSNSDLIKLFWKVGNGPSNEWTNEIQELIATGLDLRPNSVDQTGSHVEVLGMAVYDIMGRRDGLNKTDINNDSSSSSSNGTTLDPLNHFKHEYMNRMIWKSISIGSNECSRNRLNASLTFVMCQACGLPFDSLIPSIQYFRHILRFHPTTAFYQYESLKQSLKLQQTSNKTPENHLDLNPSIRVYTCSGSNNSEKLPLNGDSKVNISNRLSRNCDPLKSGELKAKSEFNFLTSSPMKAVSELVNNQVEPIENSHTDRTMSMYTADKTPKRLSWRLSDFYDYFLLDLPDICSGCIGGCQFCNGVGLL